ncbi:GNAT family N-acetyltransferase, partial [Variovorax paradoxus]|nr:GNAT family N-acetyltransferase [Variovorax paradoxus]
ISEQYWVLSVCYSVFVSGRRHAIDILTHRDFRRQGLAKAVGSAFVDECVRRGLEPGWDCFERNLSSSQLSQSLGFRPTKQFPVYSWHRISD